MASPHVQRVACAEDEKRGIGQKLQKEEQSWLSETLT